MAPARPAAACSVPVHHHRLRAVSGWHADCLRHHAEDDREQVADPSDRLPGAC
jgi:hypothetical protein